MGNMNFNPALFLQAYENQMGRNEQEKLLATQQTFADTQAEKERGWRTGERVGSQEYGTRERIGGEQFAGRQNELARALQKLMQQQQFTFQEQKVQPFEERMQGQRIQSGEKMARWDVMSRNPVINAYGQMIGWDDPTSGAITRDPTGLPSFSPNNSLQAQLAMESPYFYKTQQPVPPLNDAGMIGLAGEMNPQWGLGSLLAKGIGWWGSNADERAGIGKENLFQRTYGAKGAWNRAHSQGGAFFNMNAVQTVNRMFETNR